MERYIFSIFMLYLKIARVQLLNFQNITMNNVTKKEGESAIFVCKQTGNNTDYKWYKNEKEILGDDRRVTISNTEQEGKLSIDGLKLLDIGWYACERESKIQTKWFLSVNT
ncbi:tyrosine-protein kinase transmembrane receptor ROR2-like, partial [Saccostrea cucullata]|uniref:tyrosine-protein kinase transmembrane receptor ROR2-like n=1 Tax=Saccostrea cuccullata TaxID=36930 RepID=UPI002ED2E1E0